MTDVLKRCAILGTAQSWKQCPFNDATLEVWGLNDGYLLGQPRADRWFDLHPPHQMLFRSQTNKVVDPATIPTGVYLRPDGHLQWLRSRTFPVYLADAHADMPTAKVFPKTELLAAFAQYWPLRLTRHGTVEPGPDYEVSTPSWMLMQAIVEGYQEIHVYGIHLATEWEYVQQRPNFEFLLGIAAGKGIKIVLPDSAPICKASYRYAFEPKADLPIQDAQKQIVAIKADGMKVHQAIAKLPWYARQRRADLKARLNQLDVDLADAKQILGRAQVALHAA